MAKDPASTTDIDTNDRSTRVRAGRNDQLELFSMNSTINCQDP
jgi:hypothetical protein